MTENSTADNPVRVIKTTWRNRPAFDVLKTLASGKSITTAKIVTDDAGRLYLRKELRANHHVENDDAIALDEETVNVAAAMGATYCVAIDAASKQMWRQDIDVIRRLGWTEDRSASGWQIYLRKRHWNRTAEQLAGALHRQAPLLFPVPRDND